MNKLLKIVAAGGILLGAIKLFKMKQISEKAVSSLTDPRIHKVDLKGIAFRTGITIKNPTKASIPITKPVVTLTTGGKYITSSSPEQKEFTVQPLAATGTGDIELLIGWAALAGYASGAIAKAPAIMAAFQNKDLKALAAALAIPLEVKYSLYANGLYFESQPQKIM